MIYSIIGAIIVIGIVVGLIAFIKYLIEYSFAKKILKKYPNAPRAYFGFGYKIVTLRNMSSSERRQINIHKNLNFWKAKEEETLIYINGVEDIKQQFPDGYETWCGNVSDKMKNNIEIVFKSIDKIKALDNQYQSLMTYELWKDKQLKLSSQYAKIIVKSLVNAHDRNGKKIQMEMQIGIIYDEKTTNIKSELMDINRVHSLKNIIKQHRNLIENSLIVLLPNCYKYKRDLDDYGLSYYNISDINIIELEQYQKLIILSESDDEYSIKTTCELIQNNLKSKPLIAFCTLVYCSNETNNHINNYKTHSIDFNNTYVYQRDKDLIKHTEGDAYFFTYHNICFQTAKKAMSLCFDPFDADFMAKRTHEKYKYNFLSQYYEKSIEEIKQMWTEKRNDSAKRNKKLREDIDCLFEGKSINKDETLLLFEEFNKEWKISPYRTNWPIYDLNSRIVVIVDCLAYMNGKFILFTWARTDSALNYTDVSEELKDFGIKRYLNRYVIKDSRKSNYIKSYYSRGKADTPFEHVNDCKIDKYSIEQEIIIYILRENYGIWVDESYIVILHPNYSCPIALTQNNLKKEVEEFMAIERAKDKDKDIISTYFDYSDNIKNIVKEEDTDSLETLEIF